MNVYIKCHTNPNKPGIVYASVTNTTSPLKDVIISATLDYCLSACHERGYVVENAQDVLMWLHLNVEFEAY
jgi:hypothetical protein